MAVTGTASMTINEMREFASFAACEQRYIKRSLDIGLGRQDAFKLWARNEGENAAIRSQYVAYQELKQLRASIPADSSFSQIENFIGKLTRVAAFDQDRSLGITRVTAYHLHWTQFTRQPSIGTLRVC